jgi:hypothetical protein
MPAAQGPSDADTLKELLEIKQRLVELGRQKQGDTTARDLASIREQLRSLAADNAEVGLRLAKALGLRVDDDRVGG